MEHKAKMNYFIFFLTFDAWFDGRLNIILQTQTATQKPSRGSSGGMHNCLGAMFGAET